MNPPIETRRLTLREFTEADAGFALALLNEPAFHRYIGDKGIRTVADAGLYLREGPFASYAKHGHGLWHVSIAATGEPVGMCGLIRRDYLDAPDIGFAYLAAHCGKGYGYEAGSATLAYGRTHLGMRRILGITQPDNVASIKLLTKLGLSQDGTTIAPADGKLLLVFSTSRA
jgi:RimJ/RimL family protein N-acetyltransferase